MRITYCLAIVMTFSLATGCCHSNYPVPFLQRITSPAWGYRNCHEVEMLAQPCRADVREFNPAISGQVMTMQPQPVGITGSDSSDSNPMIINSPIMDYSREIEVESPIPNSPSLNPERNVAPQIEKAISPDDSGYLIPDYRLERTQKPVVYGKTPIFQSRNRTSPKARIELKPTSTRPAAEFSIRSTKGEPVVDESMADESNAEISRTESTSLSAPIVERSPAQSAVAPRPAFEPNTGNAADADSFRSSPWEARLPATRPGANDFVPVVETEENGYSVLKQPTSSIPVRPVSRSRVISQPQHDFRPSPPQEMNEVPADAELKPLPAKTERVDDSPIVLKATTRFRAQSRPKARIARRQMPSQTTEIGGVEFSNLPALKESAGTDSPNYFTTGDAPFQEPPRNNRIPNIEPLSNQDESPQSDQDHDAFTSPTSYQGPTEHDAAALTELNSAIDCGLVDLPNAVEPPARDQTLQALVGGGSHTNSARIVKSPVRQLQILRLRAVTPLDHQLQLPPIVGIRSTIDPIIVRGTHPDAIANDQQQPRNQSVGVSPVPARPVFDAERLEASIRGLPAQPGSNSQDASGTIDR